MYHHLEITALPADQAPLAAILQADRETIEAAIEALIARLDDIDGDCDLEDSETTEHVDARGRWLGGPVRIGRCEDDEVDDLGLCLSFGVDQSLPVWNGQLYAGPIC